MQGQWILLRCWFFQTVEHLSADQVRVSSAGDNAVTILHLDLANQSDVWTMNVAETEQDVRAWCWGLTLIPRPVSPWAIKDMMCWLHCNTYKVSGLTQTSSDREASVRLKELKCSGSLESWGCFVLSWWILWPLCLRDDDQDNTVMTLSLSPDLLQTCPAIDQVPGADQG